MAAQTEDEIESYLKRFFKFYFATAPIWRSFLTILYLAFFAYFSVFYSGKLWIALRFIIYTIIHSVSFLTLSYLFWGVIFLIALIIPFSASFYAIFLLFEIWQHNDDWTKRRKSLLSFLVIAAVPLIIFLMDKILRIVIQQEVLRAFVSQFNF